MCLEIDDLDPNCVIPWYPSPPSVSDLPKSNSIFCPGAAPLLKLKAFSVETSVLSFPVASKSNDPVAASTSSPATPFAASSPGIVA